MADINVFSVNGGGYDAVTTTSMTAAAAVQMVPCGKDSRLALRVSNGNVTDAVVRVAAGSGPRAALGDMDIMVAGGKTAYIALFDTARYKSAGTIRVALLADTNGASLGADALENIKIEAVQL